MDTKQKSRLAGHSKKVDIETTILLGYAFVCIYLIPQTQKTVN